MLFYDAVSYLRLCSTKSNPVVWLILENENEQMWEESIVNYCRIMAFAWKGWGKLQKHQRSQIACRWPGVVFLDISNCLGGTDEKWNRYETMMKKNAQRTENKQLPLNGAQITKTNSNWKKSKMETETLRQKGMHKAMDGWNLQEEGLNYFQLWTDINGNL